MKNSLKEIINKFPHIRGLKKQVDEYTKNSCYPPGHYYSPIVSVEDIRARQDEIWKSRKVDGIKGIELNTEKQIALLSSFTKYYPEMPFEKEQKDGMRFYFGNSYYCETDAILLYSYIRHFKPKKIIEVGSGFSSAVILDTCERFSDQPAELTFIEPYPERLYSLISEKDKKNTRIIEKTIQSVDLKIFEQLEQNDILFIDSTHVSKTGSDVNFILFEILPVLKKGVQIHFHDVFYPFEYPKEWVLEGKNWNEDYLLRSFLMYNNRFSIQLFAEYLHLHHPLAYSGLPRCYENTGGCLWMEKE
jgi:predicted O-methyltransferase YrrM